MNKYIYFIEFVLYYTYTISNIDILYTRYGYRKYRNENAMIEKIIDI